MPRPISATWSATDGWSATGGSADDRNNLEGIFLSAGTERRAPFPGARFSAANITADALNPYTPGAPAQDFAIVCYNCVEAPLPDLIFADGFEAGPTP
jgi:serine protease AprX